jgi:F-type H+-transporting ATPase subunit b
MSAATETKKGSAIPNIVIGVVLMFVGVALSNNMKEQFHHLAESVGIPLDPGKTVASIGVLLILFPVLRAFYFDPLSNAINERNTELERTFTEAETLKTQMTMMRTDYEQRLVATEAQAREQIQAQIREAQQLRQSLMAEAADRADALVTEAQQRIAQERENIINEIRVQVVDLTLAATEKVIGENMDSEKNRRMINEFIDKVEVPR